MRALAGKRGDGLTVLAGAALPLALAPFKLWWLAPWPLLAWLYLQQAATGQRRYGRSFLFGFGYFGTGASWVYVSIHDYGYTPVWLAALLTFLFVAGLALVFALPFWLWTRWLAARPLGVLLGFPAVWVISEWYRSWLLTGFPWLYLGYSQTETALGGWAPVCGIFGIGLWLSLLASALFVALQQRRVAALPVAVVLLGSGALLDHFEWTEPTGVTQQVALVQGNVPQQLKWNPAQREAIRTLYRELTTPLWGTEKLIVWPEAAIPELYTAEHPFFATMDAEAKAQHSALITGVPSYQRDAAGNGIYHNSLLGLGNAQGFYHKRRLVPFGEYVPLQDWFAGLLDLFNIPISEFRTGPAEQDTLSSSKLRIASSICYEIAYPALVASQARNADALLTVSNDTWFGRSIGPHQHLQMAQMRARENARELMRATSNGISALTDHKGKLLDRSPQFQLYVLKGEIRARAGMTPYQRFGDWPVLLLCALMLLVSTRARQPIC